MANGKGRPVRVSSGKRAAPRKPSGKRLFG
jgi:hypothetical protein